MKVAIPEKYRTFSNFNELLKHSYQKQEEIELDAEYFKAWIGDFLIHQMDSSKYSEIKVIMKPEEFPKPFKAKLLLDKSISIDYLEIGLKEIRENSFVLDNSKQTNSKILVTFIVDIIKNRGEFSLSINEKYKNDVKANLNIRKFLLAMQHNQSLTLKNLVSEKILFQTKTINLNEKLEEGIQKNIEILDILSSIEDFFDIIFTLPKRAFTQEEYEIIELLNFALKNKKRNRDCTEFSMTVDNKETIKNILNAFNQENPTHNLTLKKENEQLILLDQPIIIKEYIIELNNIKLKDRDVLMKKVEYFENGESIKVVFVPEKKSLIVESFIL